MSAERTSDWEWQDGIQGMFRERADGRIEYTYNGGKTVGLLGKVWDATMFMHSPYRRIVRAAAAPGDHHGT